MASDCKTYPDGNNFVGYSTNKDVTDAADIVSYKELKEIVNNRTKSENVLIVDVREPKELSETGLLPTSINIPLGKLESVWKDMPSTDFLKLFGREKPNKDFPIIFSCRSGRRSTAACEITRKLGYKNVRNYAGGWTDWEKNN